MPIIDFKEISQGNISDGRQDTFELFARDFLQMLGFKIEIGPDRGQDGGRDLVVVEERKGILDNSKYRWLVSCKHKSHSGKSVVDADETDIIDRLTVHQCNGFIGFYSTVISAPFGRKLESFKDKNKIEVQIFDNEKIEKILLMSSEGEKLIKRYFPVSFKKIDDKRPSNIFNEYASLKCEVCGKDLLESDTIHGYSAVVVLAFDTDYYYEKNIHRYKKVYWSCKGACDKKLQQETYSDGLSNGWEDISDLSIPYQFLKWNMAILNRLRSGVDEYDDEAFKQLKEFIICMCQIVYKNQSESDLKRIMSLSELPDWI
jgi:hypothetical protein